MIKSAWVTIFFMGIYLLPYAQRKDFMVAQGIDISHPVSKSFDISIVQQSIFNRNASELWIASFAGGVGYRITPQIKFELNYRFIRFRNLDNYYETRNLFFGALSYGKGLGKWYLQLRSRLQSLVYVDHFNDQFRGPIWYSRNRATLKYRFNYYWQAYCSAEVFVPTNHPVRKSIDQVRYALGMNRSLNEKVRIQLYGQYQRQVQRKNPRINTLIGVNLYYEF